MQDIEIANVTCDEGVEKMISTGRGGGGEPDFWGIYSENGTRSRESDCMHWRLEGGHFGLGFATASIVRIGKEIICKLPAVWPTGAYTPWGSWSPTFQNRDAGRAPTVRAKSHSGRESAGSGAHCWLGWNSQARAPWLRPTGRKRG